MRGLDLSGAVIRKCRGEELDEIHSIINKSAVAYRGVIPDDCMHDPYMTKEELSREVADGVEFWGLELSGALAGVMGIQYLDEVTLIRHAYVRTAIRGRGVGGLLIEYLKALTDKALLVGTWRAAYWALRFYEKHGFVLLGEHEHAVVLKRYWRISERQVDTSVVLADDRWSGMPARGED